METQGVSRCFECGVDGEGEEDTVDEHFYCFACWLIYHAARARLRRDSAHVPPVRNFQDASSAPESAQYERSVQNVSFTFGQRPQLQRPGARTQRCTVQNASSAFEQRAQPACTQITTQEAQAHEGGSAVEESEEHFGESEHDGLDDEERSSDGEDGFGEEVDKTPENEGEGCRSPEGSDFAAEEGYEEGDSNAEEGHEEVWGEVQEALSTMGNEDYDETDCVRSQASRSSSSSWRH